MTSQRSGLRPAATVVRPLGHGEAARVGEVLADSHAAYPSFAHLFPDPARRRRILRSFFTGIARDAVPFGAVDGAWSGPRMMAVAVWLPPGRFPWSPARKARATPSFLGRLVEFGLARVDASGMAGYLETADHANLAFYERFGFALERELQLIPDGPPHWAMRRPAAGGPTDGGDPARAGRDTDEPEVRS